MDSLAEKKLTKREKRLLRRRNVDTSIQYQEKTNFQLKDIQPLTENQRLTFKAFEQGKHLMLHGIAGTGKSFLAVFLATRQVISGDTSYKKVVIVRSVVPTRDMGFLPGNTKEKTKVYEAPYQQICSEICGRGDAYDYLKNKGLVEFISTSFIRGTTLNNCIVIVDEMANCTLHELDSVITRCGKNCKIIFCGDFRQSDFTKDHEKDGIHDFMRIIQRMKYFYFVDFDENDIVRSALVKDYIITKNRLGIDV
jgi:phosphate starvation-inducible protein PhoH